MGCSSYYGFKAAYEIIFTSKFYKTSEVTITILAQLTCHIDFLVVFKINYIKRKMLFIDIMRTRTKSPGFTSLPQRDLRMRWPKASVVINERNYMHIYKKVDI